jgi:hypothetical protein
MQIRYAIGLAPALAFAAHCEAFVTPRHVTLASMDKNTRELFQQSMDLDDQLFDEDVKLVRRPGPGHDGARLGGFLVRESSWYALGLLLRDVVGDRQRAADILDAVQKQQYLCPGTKWYGLRGKCRG